MMVNGGFTVQHLKQLIAIPAVSLLLPISLCAQWLHLRTPGIPRTSDGKPNLAAPAPRTADGKPDLSGLWRSLNFVPYPYVVDLIQDIKDEAIFKPAAEAVLHKRLAELGRDWPPRHCLPVGPAEGLIGTYRIIQSPTVVALLSNADVGDDYRQIFLDGRELPRDPNPTWRGYSVGHWEGDTLVVESAGFNDRSWLDMVGHPHSERLHVTERFQRVDFGHIDLQVTFDDPEMMTRPLNIREVINYMPDTEMLEGVCENERDAPHLAGQTAIRGVEVSVAILANYAGTYELRDALPGLPPGFPPPYTVTLVNGQLYVGALQLIPQSETRFQEFDGGYVEFSRDASGAVTGLTRDVADSQSAFFRKR
jgi:hypothetical protein